MRVLVVLFFICTLVFGKISVDNGNSLILEFNKNDVSEIKIGKKKLQLLSHPVKKNVNIVFIPVKYRQKKDIVLTYLHKNRYKKLNINVKQKEYKKEFLKVHKSRVKPPKKVVKRIRNEYKEAMRIYKTFGTKRHWNKPFINPINSKITSQYGNARIFNGKLKSFHGGTDFRAKIKTPVRATNDGVVVLSKDRYYAGGSVIISHGDGIYSCYYHLSNMPLKVGQKVKQGDIIGLSGKSGRVTGPHLHFTIMLRGVSVDSQDFIKKINALFGV